MKIAFLSRYQHSILRGAETFVFELSQYLSKDHEVIVLSGENADSFKKIIYGKYDLVIAMNGRTQSLKASFGRLLSNYKLVIVGESGIGRDDLWNIVVCRPDAFVAITGKAFRWAKKRSWGSKVVKIPNGVDLNKFKPVGEKLKTDLPGKVVLSVGALEWYKHHEKTINAVALLDNVSLIIVGKGSLKKQLNELGQQKLKGRFKIIELNYTDIPKIYRSADLFVLPSWDREAFGIVYIEALASNIPVVAPNDENRKEIIGEAGILVDVYNPEKYAEAIKRALITDWENKPRQQAEKFSWEVIAKEYEKLFKELLNYD